MIPRASFFSEMVPEGKPARSAWFKRALVALSPADLLFFDPDNGLEVPSTPFGSKNSSKYLYWSEVGLAWESGVSLLIFQHFPRENRDTYIDRLVRKLQREVPNVAVTSLRTPNVLFLLASQPDHNSTSQAALDMARTRWQGPITI